MKAQGIRLIDVFLLGPVMIYAAGHKKTGRITRLMLLAGGIATILYNVENWMTRKKLEN